MKNDLDEETIDHGTEASTSKDQTPDSNPQPGSSESITSGVC